MSERKTHTVAVVSGKGGVGKSLVAVNLAEALQQAGHNVGLFDGDLDQPDCATLLNEAPPASLPDYLTSRCGLRDVMHETDTGLSLISGSRTIMDLTLDNTWVDRLDRILRHVEREHDFVLIDTPAGTGPLVQWALDRAGHGLLVIVDEPTSINDAYRLAKLVWRRAPSYPLHVVANLCETAEEAHDVHERFATITSQFVGNAPDYLGWIPFARSVWDSVKNQQPVVRSDSPPANAFKEMARRMGEQALALNQ